MLHAFFPQESSVLFTTQDPFAMICRKVPHTTTKKMIYFTSAPFSCLLNIADPSMLWAQIPLLPGVSMICFFKTNYSKPPWLITIIYHISQGLLVRRVSNRRFSLGVSHVIVTSCQLWAQISEDITGQASTVVQSYGWQLTMASSWELSWAFNEETFGISLPIH